MTNDRLRSVLDRIDDENRNDPTLDEDGTQRVPKALLYGQRMTAWLHRLLPDPSEALQIAVRGQHIGRWNIPRSDYPANRAGYLAWRTRLYGYHADRIAAIMRTAGYEDPIIERAARIVAKKGLRQDPEVQALEDVACLVFLNYEFAKFAAEHPREKIIDIVRKTWNKMSEQGRAAALALQLPEPLADIVQDALSG
jgi:hypothetical protein